MKEKAIQLWVGIFVLLGISSLVFIALSASNLNAFSSGDGYRIKASFSEIGGLKKSAPVTIAGVRVGRVESIYLDLESFQARVVLNIDEKYDQIPIDSSLSILTAGLLGEKYIGLTPGGEEEYLADGEFIEITQSAIVLENLISTFLNN